MEPYLKSRTDIPLLLDHIATLESHIKELEAKNRWIPVSERLPEGDQMVLFANFRDGITDEMRVGYYDRESKHSDYQWHVYDAGNGFNHHNDWATHWMPLPEGPEEES